jgi:nucleotide-binding universal stress UspA family protein
MMKILIAVDGSEHSKRAIEAAAALTRASAQLEVTLLHVRDGPMYYGELTPASVAQINKAQQQHQEQVLTEAQEYARSLKLNVGSLQRAEGYAPQEIVRVAAAVKAEQIVLGTRGMGAVGSLFLGSVAQRVVHLAKVPVLLAK